MFERFLRADRFKITSEEAIIIIPARVIGSGCSAGSRIQLSSEPKRGIRNFHKFRSETTMPGLFKRVIQIEIATADSKLNQPRER